jgi:hypothetical protein
VVPVFRQFRCRPSIGWRYFVRAIPGGTMEAAQPHIALTVWWRSTTHPGLSPVAPPACLARSEEDLQPAARRWRPAVHSRLFGQARASQPALRSELAGCGGHRQTPLSGARWDDWTADLPWLRDSRPGLPAGRFKITTPACSTAAGSPWQPCKTSACGSKQTAARLSSACVRHVGAGRGAGARRYTTLNTAL